MTENDTSTQNPTPQYNIGDRVKIPHRKLVGEIFDREYSDNNESWIYFINLDTERMNTVVYQEKSLIQ